MSTRTHYTQIPHVIDDSDLSPHAFRLYCHIKRVAGESGECWKGTKALAEACKMSTGMVSKARQELLDGGWIEKTGTGPNGAWVCRVADVWKRNQNAGAQIVHNMNDLGTDDNKDRSQYERPNANRSQYERNRSQYETKKNTEEEPLNEEERDLDAHEVSVSGDVDLLSPPSASTENGKYFGLSDPRPEWDSHRQMQVRNYDGIDPKLLTKLTNELKRIRGYSALVDRPGRDDLEDEFRQEAYDCWQMGVADVDTMKDMHDKWLEYAKANKFKRMQPWANQFYKFVCQVVSGDVDTGEATEPTIDFEWGAVT